MISPLDHSLPRNCTSFLRQEDKPHKRVGCSSHVFQFKFKPKQDPNPTLQQIKTFREDCPWLKSKASSTGAPWQTGHTVSVRDFSQQVCIMWLSHAPCASLVGPTYWSIQVQLSNAAGAHVARPSCGPPIGPPEWKKNRDPLFQMGPMGFTSIQMD